VCGGGVVEIMQLLRSPNHARQDAIPNGQFHFHLPLVSMLKSHGEENTSLTVGSCRGTFPNARNMVGPSSVDFFELELRLERAN